MLNTVSDVTQLLDAAQRGEPQATATLIPLVYDELRRLAAQHLAREKPGQTLQATALVHEAYLRLINHDGDRWENRRHFFAAAAEAMRRIVVDHARRKQAQKRGGEAARVDIDLIEVPIPLPSEEVLMVDEALEGLAQVDPPAAHLVKLRFFVGMSLEEAADLMGVSTRTVDRMWALAKAWLQRVLQSEGSSESQS